VGTIKSPEANKTCIPFDPNLQALSQTTSGCCFTALSASSNFLTSLHSIIPTFSQDFMHSTVQIMSSPKQLRRSDISWFKLLNTLSTSADMAGIQWIEGVILASWDHQAAFRRICQNVMWFQISSAAGKSRDSCRWSVLWLTLLCLACFCFQRSREALSNNKAGRATKSVEAELW